MDRFLRIFVTGCFALVILYLLAMSIEKLPYERESVIVTKTSSFQTRFGRRCFVHFIENNKEHIVDIDCSEQYNVGQKITVLSSRTINGNLPVYKY